MAIYQVPDWTGGTRCHISFSKAACKAGSIIISSILQLMNLRHREIEDFAQGHLLKPVNEEQGSEPRLFDSCLYPCCPGTLSPNVMGFALFHFGYFIFLPLEFCLTLFYNFYIFINILFTYIQILFSLLHLVLCPYFPLSLWPYFKELF